MNDRDRFKVEQAWLHCLLNPGEDVTFVSASEKQAREKFAWFRAKFFAAVQSTKNGEVTQ